MAFKRSIGTNGSDTLNDLWDPWYWSPYDDDSNITVHGYGGQDHITINNGNDTVYAGDGDDTVVDSGGSHTNNNDYIDGGAGNDTIFLQNGSNTVNGGTENDTIYDWSTGGDTVWGGEGNDTVVVSATGYYNSYDGGNGVDKLNLSGMQRAYVDLSTGQLVLRDLNFNSVGGGTVYNFENVIGTNNGDNITGNASANIIEGWDGADIIDGGAGNDTIVGGDGDDYSLYGNQGIDWVYGSNGNDTIGGGADGDFLYGEQGYDTITGGTGADYIDGGTELDWLYGEAGDDTLIGGTGDDWLIGGQGRDAMNGGAGVDTASYWDAASRVEVYLRAGTGTNVGDAVGDTFVSIEKIQLSQFGDRFGGSVGSDTVYGGGGADLLAGDAGDDFLYGEDSAVGTLDVLYGNAGHDLLDGGVGNDFINGGTGNDTLYGGIDSYPYIEFGTGSLVAPVRDYFMYTEMAWGRDTIMDFQDRTDLVDMRALGTSGIHSLADFTMTQLGTSTVMTRGADSITFANTNVSQLTSTDFLFA